MLRQARAAIALGVGFSVGIVREFWPAILVAFTAGLIVELVALAVRP